MSSALWRGGTMVGVLVVALTTCAGASSGAGTVDVVVSVFPLYHFVRRVGGPQVRVTLLVPPGTEPHDWEPAPADLVRVRSARLFVYNGAGFESWAERMVSEVRDRGPRVISAARGLASLVTNGQTDPHVWLDPLLAREQVEIIRAALGAADPEHGRVYDANAAVFSRRLLDLHERFATGLTQCSRREIVVSHAAFAYLARRYHLVQTPIIKALAPDAEPNPADLAALARHARRAGVTHVFSETLVAPRLAETLAREIGARVLSLNPIEGLTKEEEARGLGYIELMDVNLRNLRTGLDCQ